MRPETKPIQTLLLQIFLPAVLFVATLLAVFAYNWHHATIIESFDRKLITISALTGAMIDPEDHDALMEAAFAGADPELTEAGPQYRRNAGPIERIQRRLGLTYLYTQALGGEQDIVYVLDGTLGEEHSPIGSPDDLTEQTLAGLQDAEANGSVFVSPVEYQEQWGLLKTAAAPVYAGSGEISATAGADVNISQILVATQNALFASTLIGIGSIILCLFIALTIMRKVARPIEALKDQALAVAADQGGSGVSAEGPREVVGLSQALGEMAGKIEELSHQREKISAEHERAANIALLADDIDAPVLLLHQGDVRLFWVSKGSGDVEGALAAMGARQLARQLMEEPKLADQWKALADTRSGVCLEVNRAAGTIELVGDTKVVIIRGDVVDSLQPGSAARFDPTTDQVGVGGGAPISLELADDMQGGQP